MRLITFLVDVPDDPETYDYDDVRRLVGDGTAEVYTDRPIDLTTDALEG